MFKISADALDLALASVGARGDTDIFPVPFEFTAIQYGWDRVRDRLLDLDLDVYAVRPLRQSLSTKRALGYRFGTSLDPLDHLLATALTIEMAPHLEASRLPEGLGRVHSYRFDPGLLASEGLLYSYHHNYATFHEASLAAASDDDWIVLTDIADFYTRLYLHPIESALHVLTPIRDQARVFLKMLKAWNQRVSYGIPVGPGFSRLIAEATIADVDQLLLAEGVNFFRYSDDYRFVVSTRREGHRVLSLLAETLSQSHGLTLNEAKTEIVRADEYKARWEERKDRPSVRDLVAELETAGWSLTATIYNDQIDDNELPREVLEALDRLDLPALVRHELEERTPEPLQPDYPILNFAIGQMAVAHSDCLDVLACHAHRLYPIAPRVAFYLGHVGSSLHYHHDRRDLAREILHRLLEDPAASSLPYLRSWWLHAGRATTLPIDLVASQYNDHPDEFTRPASLLAAADSQSIAWLRPKRRDLSVLGPWTRRALIGALSILPPDEYKAWLGANVRSFDELEVIVADWARSEVPFGS